MASRLRWVHLRTVPDAWHAHVLVARLGAEGIITSLRGNVAGPYPFGAVSVLVEEDQAQLAAELLLADEVEAAFSEQGHPAEDERAAGEQGVADGALRPGAGRWASRRRRALAALAAAALAGAPVLAHFIGQ
jgi:hypothetical protein